MLTGFTRSAGVIHQYHTDGTYDVLLDENPVPTGRKARKEKANTLIQTFARRVSENNLFLEETNTYYYEEQTRNGKQWFRITANGDWMPKPEKVEQKYDRAGMATAAIQGLLASGRQTVTVVKDAVWYADSLIAELERTKP